MVSNDQLDELMKDIVVNVAPSKLDDYFKDQPSQRFYNLTDILQNYESYQGIDLIFEPGFKNKANTEY